MSARISGVKNLESKADSLVRGLPLSQVQSQSENGAIFGFSGNNGLLCSADAATGVGVAAATLGWVGAETLATVAEFSGAAALPPATAPLEVTPFAAGTAFAGAPPFCCSTSVRKRSTSSLSALISFLISCRSVSSEADPEFAAGAVGP